MKMDKTSFFFLVASLFEIKTKMPHRWTSEVVEKGKVLLTNQKRSNRLQRNKKSILKCWPFCWTEKKKKSGCSNEKKNAQCYTCVYFFFVDQHFPCWLAPLGSEGVEQSVMPSVGLWRAVTMLLQWGGGASEGQQPGGVEQQGVELLGVNGSMERRLRTAALDFRQQVLNLFDRYQDLKKRNKYNSLFLFSFSLMQQWGNVHNYNNTDRSQRGSAPCWQAAQHPWIATRLKEVNNGKWHWSESSSPTYLHSHMPSKSSFGTFVSASIFCVTMRYKGVELTWTHWTKLDWLTFLFCSKRFACGKKCTLQPRASHSAENTVR